MTKLFIIGNGFDRAHGYKTSYDDFRDYMYKLAEGELDFNNGCPPVGEIIGGNHHSDFDTKKLARFLVYMIEETGWLIEGDEDERDKAWHNFEKALGKLNLSEAYDIENIYNYGDDGIDTEFDDKAINQGLQSIYDISSVLRQLNVLFKNWVKQIEIDGEPKPDLYKLFHEDENSLFLSFNYTETLETVYDIPEERICYIHGRRNSDENLIIGYAPENERQFTKEDILNARLMSVDRDFFKNPEQHEWDNIDFFKKLIDVDEIYDYGWSIADNTVDEYYLNDITSYKNIKVFHLQEYGNKKKSGENESENDRAEHKLRKLKYKGKIIKSFGNAE